MNAELKSLKHWFKTTTYLTFSAVVSPLIVTYRIHAKLASQSPFQHYVKLLAFFPGIIGREIRHAFYRHTLCRCGRNLKIGFGSYFTSPHAQVGENVTMGSYCVIGPCTIGNDVAMASHIVIMPSFDPTATRLGLEQSTQSPPKNTSIFSKGYINIGDLTWIGEGARIYADVGDKAIVGIGAVVKRSTQEAVIVFGNPARTIGKRTAPLSSTH